MTQIEDKIIISELKKGNKEVFQSLFHHYYPILLTFSHRYIYDEDTRNDMIQNAFTKLWEKRAKLEISSIKNYLFGIVRNECLHFLRHCDVQDKHQAMVLESYLDNLGELVDVDEETKDQVIKGLNKLPESMRKIFVQKYVNNLSALEIADEMNVSTNTVNTQLKRAKAKLRHHLLHAELRLFMFFL